MLYLLHSMSKLLSTLYFCVICSMLAPFVLVARFQRFGCCSELTEVQFLGSNSGLGVLILKIGNLKVKRKPEI